MDVDNTISLGICAPVFRYFKGPVIYLVSLRRFPIEYFFIPFYNRNDEML